jgi:hypothetical protein
MPQQDQPNRAGGAPEESDLKQAAPRSIPKELTESVHAGRTGLPRDTQNWDVFVQNIKKYYVVDSPQFAPAETLAHIEKDFVFETTPTDEEYRPLHVEPLLDQAANLLDRCLSARYERDRLAIEKFKLETDLEQFFRTDQINDEEVKAGLFTVPYEKALLDSLAESEVETFTTDAQKEINKSIQLIRTQFTEQKNARYAAMFLPNAPQYAVDPGETKLEAYFVGGVAKPKLDQLAKAAELLSEAGMIYEAYNMYAQYSSYRASAGAGGFRRKSLETLAEWSRKDIAFKRQRKQVAFEIAVKRASQTYMDKGVLNYKEKIEVVEKRFSSDLREVIARLIAIQTGMKQLYGYVDPELGEFKSGFSFDDTVLWVRNAISWLVRFSRIEQNYVLPISVKQTASAWASGLSQGEWTFDVKEETCFPAQRNIRLRGISAAITSNNADGLWRVSIRAPKRSYTRHISTNEVVDLDQSKLPACILGRVTNRYGRREAEITGINALHNASPFGTWSVAIAPQSLEGIPTKTISDVQLDLHLAVRTI